MYVKIRNLSITYSQKKKSIINNKKQSIHQPDRQSSNQPKYHPLNCNQMINDPITQSTNLFTNQSNQIISDRLANHSGNQSLYQITDQSEFNPVLNIYSNCKHNTFTVKKKLKNTTNTFVNKNHTS